mmetsp:Transcript_22470/g.62051  ORF Transcript_22470/g.62051 Transcript_22470/m.62051 type:complete len:91 (+) Transcript_22470:918-1190(+)|eukprot:1156120-Pelagomonas_calceolata.AAC.5
MLQARILRECTTDRARPSAHWAPAWLSIRQWTGSQAERDKYMLVMSHELLFASSRLVLVCASDLKAPQSMALPATTWRGTTVCGCRRSGC